MKKAKAIAAGALLAVLATAVGSLSFPASSSGFALIGGSLAVASNGYQRDVRVFNNSFDSSANNNVTAEISHPGALGAPLSVWKAAEAWNSNSALASRNFDFDWQGAASSNLSNQNTVGWGTSGCGGSVLAYTEMPLQDGWRIVVCEGWTWSDGPGNPSFNEIDIQGVIAHELGHALGLDHSTAGCGTCSDTPSGHATMCFFICSSGVQERTLQSDDQAGLQAIYGAKPVNKPTISSISGSVTTGQTLLINGSNFADTVNVKFTAGTSQNSGAIPGVVYSVPSTGGTQVSVTIPQAANDGNVLVWQPDTLLSNPYPININFVPPPAPVLSGATPRTAQVWGGDVVTLSGTGLTGTTQVNSGGTLLNQGSFAVLNDTTITYSVPRGSALGSVNVHVSTPSGTSNDVSFAYVETHPPRMTAPAFTWTNQTLGWSFGGGAEDAWILLVAPDSATFPYHGYPVLLNFFPLFGSNLDTAGFDELEVLVPSGFGGLQVWSQIVCYGENSGPFVGSSNILSTTIIF